MTARMAAGAPSVSWRSSVALLTHAQQLADGAVLQFAPSAAQYCRELRAVGEAYGLKVRVARLKPRDKVRALIVTAERTERFAVLTTAQRERAALETALLFALSDVPDETATVSHAPGVQRWRNPEK